jgi:hypothetical protein
MAFPSIVTTNTTNGTAAATNKVCNLPAGIAAGDLLILMIRSAAADTHTTPAGGWADLIKNHSGDASDDVTSIFYKMAASGSEGATVTVNGTASLKFSALSWRITGHSTTDIPEISTAAIGSSVSPNPATLSLADPKDYLLLWLGAWEGEQTSPPASNPTNYSSNIIGADSGTAGAITSNSRCASASRQANVSSENPGIWTISAADEWTAWTLGVHPFEVVGTAHALAGTIAARSSISGRINKASAFLSRVQGSSSDQGQMSTAKILDVDLTARSSFVSSMSTSVSLGGSIGARSSLSGNSIVQKDLDTDLAAVSSLSGDLSVEEAEQVLGFTSMLAFWMGGAGIPAAIITQLEGAIYSYGSLGAEVYSHRQVESPSDGESELEGTLGILRSIEGVLRSVSTMGSTLNKNAGLDVDVSGDSDFDGKLTVLRSLQGGINAISRLTGNTNVGKQIESSMGGSSSLSGSLWKAAEVRSTVQGSSSSSGNANIGRTLDVDVSGASDLDGQVSVLRSLQGSLSGQSSLSGRVNLGKQIEGGVRASGTLAGDLWRTANVQSIVQSSSASSADANMGRLLDVDLSARSSLSGTISTITAVPISGRMDAVSAFNGEVTITRQILVEGLISGVSRLGADTHLARQVDSDAESRSTLNGSLSLLKNFAGLVRGNTQTSSNVDTYKLLDVDVTGQSTLSGSLFVDSSRPLAGTIATRSTFNSNANVVRGGSSSDVSNSSIDGSLVVERAITGQIYGTSVLSGDLTTSFNVDQSLQGRLDGVSRFRGSPSLVVPIAGQLDALSIVYDGVIFIDRGASTEVAGQSVLSGDISIHRHVLGSLYGQSILIGDMVVTPVNVDYDDHYFNLYIKSTDSFDLYIKSLESFDLYMKSSENIALVIDTEYNFNLYLNSNKNFNLER